jgi:LuxR family maltose regulon positive regulatory protein
LELLAHRLTDREIAETLVISPFTVRRHVRNISEKMGEHGRRTVVERARTLGLLPTQLI